MQTRKKRSPSSSLSFLMILSLHIRPADFRALQLPDRLPQALINGTNRIHNRDRFAVFGPVGFGAVFAREPGPEIARDAEVDPGADVEVEDVARVGVGLYFGRERRKSGGFMRNN